MAVRFILGRAGTGKTHHCLEAIRSSLADDAIDGPRLVFLVPEQASVQMERAILTPSRSGEGGAAPAAAHRAEVLSFRRLAHRVLDAGGAAMERRALSETARSMVLAELMMRRADSLTYYRGLVRRRSTGGRLGGLVEAISKTVAELIEEAIDPADLCSAFAAKQASAPDNPAGQAKLHDLALIYQAYLDFLGDDKLDPSQHLALARESLPQCHWLDGARLWVDGFASLSGQETLTLIELSRKCQSAVITAMIDPNALDQPDSLFARIQRTYQTLRDRLLAAGVEVDAPQLLTECPPRRFRGREPLAHVECGLFARVDSDTRLATAGGAPHGVEIVELPTRRLEVEYAVSRVCRWVQDPTTGYRYRDVAIIARELDHYHELLTAALSARNIPFFIDRRRPVSHHPLFELLRLAPGVTGEGMTLETMRLFLKTGLLGVSFDDADELENHLIAQGISTTSAWREGPWTLRGRSALGGNKRFDGHEADRLARVNATRRKVLAQLEPWLTFAAGAARHTGAAWAEALTDWLSHLGAEQVLQQWAEEADALGELDEAEEHRQAWRESQTFLDDVAFAFSDRSLTASELSDLFEAGLTHPTLGLVPPMIDQVLVGSVERSRHPDIAAAVVIGFNDGTFPKELHEDAILNDDDRATLTAAGVPVRPPSRERVIDESLLAYVALTRAAEALVVTYALSGDSGRALRPSPFVQALCAACPGLKITRAADPTRERDSWDILSTADLVRRLASEFSTRPRREEDCKTLRGRWNALYDSQREALHAEPVARQALASLTERTDTHIAPQSVERLYPGTLETSVSQLESFAVCPFQHFARHVLRLRQRPEAVLEPVDVGTVHHAILEEFVRSVAATGQGFAQLSESELLGGLQESCERVAAQVLGDGITNDARSAYVMRRSAASLARVMRAQRAGAVAGATKPRATELAFGFDKPGSLPALELTTPHGRTVRLRGFIDRVDIAEIGDELLGIVIDYKRTRGKRLELDKVYHGLSLQLPAYLLVLAAHGRTLAGRPIRPISALYVSLLAQYESVNHPDEKKTHDPALAGSELPQGLILAGDCTALESSGPDGWSQHFHVFHKKDGGLGHINNSDATDKAAFRGVLDHTRTLLGAHADALLDGDVAVRPYRLGNKSPCSWCPMMRACRFETGLSDMRFLETLKRTEVFARLTKAGA